MHQSTRWQLARMAEARKAKVREILEETVARIKASQHHTAAHRRQSLAEAATMARAEFAQIDAEVDRQVREGMSALAEERFRKAPETAKDATMLLLEEQRLNRHLSTLRERYKSGALREGALTKMLEDAQTTRDVMLLNAVEEILPEMQSYLSHHPDPATRGVQYELMRLKDELPALREGFKTQAEREIDAEEALANGIVAELNAGRRQDAETFLGLEIDADYHIGANVNPIPRIFLVGKARERGLTPSYRPIGADAEVPMPDNTKISEAFGWKGGRA